MSPVIKVGTKGRLLYGCIQGKTDRPRRNAGDRLLSSKMDFYRYMMYTCRGIEPIGVASSTGLIKYPYDFLK